MAQNKIKNKKVVVISGGFDPVHIGHVRLMKEARALGDELIVLINNDNWLFKKKGYVFMDQHERKEIIESFACVSKAVFTSHGRNPKDMSVSKDLLKIKPDIFANGGDRVSENTPENLICARIGSKMVFNVGQGGKVQSSSWLVNKASEKKAKVAEKLKKIGNEKKGTKK